MRHLVQIGLLGSALVFSTTPTYSAESKPDLTGVYRCEGEGYKGTVLIRKSGEGYQILWSIGADTHYGVAIQEGDLLSSSWTTTHANIAGIVVYRIEKGRVLKGTYMAYPGGKLQTETLTWIGPTQ